MVGVAANPCPVGMLLWTDWRPSSVSLLGDKDVGDVGVFPASVRGTTRSSDFVNG